MFYAFLRFVFFAALGLVVFFALATWRYLPPDPSTATLKDRVITFSNRATSDLFYLMTMEEMNDIQFEAAAGTDLLLIANPDESKLRLLVEMGDSLRKEFILVAKERKRVEFWYNVAFGTAGMALGGLLGGLFRRRPKYYFEDGQSR